MKKNLMMLLIILSSLVACGYPKIEPVERCSLFLSDTLDTSKCRCHMYDLDVKGGQIIGESVDHPVMYCDRSVMFRTDESGAWETIVNWRDELIIWIEDNKKNKK